MTVKATENCIKSLIANAMNTADIVVLNSTVTLDTVYLQSLRIDCTCQVDTLRSSSENWFENFWNVTEAELHTILTESEEDNLLPDPIDCIVQAINFIHFDWPQCPILRLQKQLQATNLKIDVLEQNPYFSKYSSRSCIKNYRALFLILSTSSLRDHL